MVDTRNISARTRARKFVLSWYVVALVATALTVVGNVGVAAADESTTFTVYSESGTQTATDYFAPSFSTPESGSFVTPTNFSKGNAYLHLVVDDKPSSKLTEAQPCFWRHEPTPWNQESCSGRFSFTDEGDFWIDLGAPDNWFKLRDYEWNTAFDVTRLMLKDDDQKLLIGTKCGTECYPGDDLDDHVPISLTSELVFTGLNSELTPPAGWENCPRSWSSECSGDDVAASAPADRETPSITVSPGPGEARLDWIPTEGSESYRVRYRVPGETWSTPTVVGNVSSATIPGLSADQSYEVALGLKIRNKWQSAWVESNIHIVNPVSAPASGPVTVEGVPTVTATPDDSSIHVEWTDVPNAQKYRYRLAVGDSAWQSIVQVDLNTEIDLAGLTNGVPHTVAVSPRVNNQWKSAWTEVTVTPGLTSVDTDGDGVLDNVDNCPTDPNADQADVDGDGIGDACDPDNNDGPTADTDGDGIINTSDNCPTDPNGDQADIDGDGIGDACDPDNNDGPTADTDGDGIINTSDNCPTDPNTDQADIDGDNIGDACDPDNNDGPTADTDGDGIINTSDNCPTDPNTDQADIDGDGIGDACDPTNDADTSVTVEGSGTAPTVTVNALVDALDVSWLPVTNAQRYRYRYRQGEGAWTIWTQVDLDTSLLLDGLTNGTEYTVDVSTRVNNKWKAESTQVTATPIAPDSDGDNIGDPIDNCPAIPNPDQADADGDGIGDACDPDNNDGPTADTDGDGIINTSDNCPTDPNGDQADIDGDGIGDACDPDNNDGPTADTDGDGIINTSDNCPTDPNTDQADIDGDNIGDACDPDNNDGPTADTDGDGIINTSDNCPTDPNTDQADIDGDNIGDACDPTNDADTSVTVEGSGTAPTVTVNALVDALDVSWLPVTNAQRYRYRYRQGEGAWTIWTQVDLDTSLLLDGLTNGTEYTVDVSTRVNNKWKAESTQVTATPIAPDSDGDNIGDPIDNCPAIPNPDQADADGDGIGDACDPDNTDGPTADTDGDGIINTSDNCPTDPNGDQADVDGDGIGDACDPDNTDGPLADNGSTTVEGSPTVTATPGDAQIQVEWATVADAQKYRYRIAVDGDAWQPIIQVGHNTQILLSDLTNELPHTVAVSARVNNKWKSNWTEVTVTPSALLGDPDGDGWRNFEDNCPNTEQFDQSDIDTDGVGDACDDDIDGDGLGNAEDNCLNDANVDQTDLDGDNIGDACDPDNTDGPDVDPDGDGLLNANDNCNYDANVDQTDLDGDNIGDACDPDNTDGPDVDPDGDGLLNANDNCNYDANVDQTDLDGDNIGDACDPDNTDGPLGDLDVDGVQNGTDNCPNDPNPDQADGNGNGVGNICDNTGSWVTVEDEGPFVIPVGAKRTRYMRTPAWEPGRIGWVNFCESTHHAQVDPLVNPGDHHSNHLHEFFGNPSINANTDTISLGTTPRDDIACSDRNDFAGYWSPAVFQDDELITADYIHTYYKASHVSVNKIKPMPVGLRMVAGDAHATENQSEQIGWWEQKRNSSFTDIDDLINTRGATEMISLRPRDSLILRINFPNCWDGIHLDSPDHKSHVAYHTAGQGCPASHPVAIPQLVTFTKYDIPGGDGFDLASGEWYSFHQDFWNAWDESQMINLINECIKTTGNCRPNPGPELSPVQEEIFIPSGGGG